MGGVVAWKAGKGKRDCRKTVLILLLLVLLILTLSAVAEGQE
jgi:hypothetical protein